MIKKNYLAQYLLIAPLPLALERSLECKILEKQKFKGPILDIGCGEGIFAKILFNHKVDLGVDPNKKELDRAKKIGIYKELIQCYGNKISQPSHKFNTIFSNSVLEHIPNMKLVLKEAYRLLNPGGKLYITVPTNNFDQYTLTSQLLLFFGLKKLQKKYCKIFNLFWRHYHYYDPSKWTKILKKSGYEVLKVQTYGSKNFCMLNDFLTPLSILEFLTKKLFNQWTLFPVLRKIIFYPILPIANKLLKKSTNVKNGGLVFISAKKPNHKPR